MNDRGTNGQFCTGNPGGPGRPPRQTEEAYLNKIKTACPPERWDSIVNRAVLDAEGGDRFAREWLAKWLMPASQTVLAESDRGVSLHEIIMQVEEGWQTEVIDDEWIRRRIDKLPKPESPE